MRYLRPARELIPKFEYRIIGYSVKKVLSGYLSLETFHYHLEKWV